LVKNKYQTALTTTNRLDLIRLEGLCDAGAREIPVWLSAKPKDFKKTLKKAGKTTYSGEIAKKVTDTTG